MTEVLPPTIAQMSVGVFNNSKHWQERAEEARVHAEQLTDPEAKQMMLDCRKLSEVRQEGPRATIERRTRRKIVGTPSAINGL
jgi:hypothetical protein